MYFSKLSLFARFIIPSSIEAERGHETVYVKIPSCIPLAHYQEDMQIVMQEVSKIKNQNYLDHQLSRLANAVSEDGKSFVHISDEKEIREANKE